jgi:hypothetical protein
VEIGSSMATRNWSSVLAATIRARADRAAGFKRCCMSTGRFDGSEREYYRRD